MPEPPIRFLLDQNVPQEIVAWLQEQRPGWLIEHVNQIGLRGQPDRDIFLWAQANQAIVVTYDEDFADVRMFPLGSHWGIVRLRVWPTTVESTQAALQRLISLVPVEKLRGSLVIIDPSKIRLRQSR